MDFELLLKKFVIDHSVEKPALAQGFVKKCGTDIIRISHGLHGSHASRGVGTRTD
jgi:hypothetical protein